MKTKLLAVFVTVMIAMLLVLASGCGKKETQEEITSEPVVEPVVQPESETVVPAETEDVIIPETEAGEDYVDENALESGEFTQENIMGAPQNADTTLAKDFTKNPERFSNFECKADAESGIKYISLKVTNTNTDQDFMISPKGVAKGYNTYFMVRGMVDMDPGCAVEKLAPGESTVCNMIGKDDARYGNVVGINKIVIQSPNNEGNTKAESVAVNCPAE